MLYRLSAACGAVFLVVFLGSPARGQQIGSVPVIDGTTGIGDIGAANAAAAGAAGGGSTQTGTGTDASLGMDLSQGVQGVEAFSGIQRSETIGATGESGQGFGLGATTSGLGGGLGAGGGFGGLGGLGGFGGIGGFGGLNSFFGGGQGQAAQPAIRTRLRSAVQVAPITPQRVQQSATGRLSSLPSGSRIDGPVRVSVSGRTAVIEGVVGSERDRRMSELLMRLEPGVSNVENRIRVAP
jgi:hypothetical protein